MFNRNEKYSVWLCFPVVKCLILDIVSWVGSEVISQGGITSSLLLLFQLNLSWIELSVKLTVIFLIHLWTVKCYCFKHNTLATVGCLQLGYINRMDQGHPSCNLLEFSTVAPGVNLAQCFGISNKGHSCSLPSL